jgi:uncharacterized protein (TIGR03084 family)
MREILSDLVAEQQALDQFLQSISERAWVLPTPARGWSIKDTVSHLAFSEEFAIGAIRGGNDFVAGAKIAGIDQWTARGVRQGRGKRHQEVIEWWRNGRAAVVEALSRMEPSRRIPWLVTSVGARTFATLRLMETWAHGLDIQAAMEGRLPPPDDEDEAAGDSPRIRHIAWLAHRMLRYAFDEAGEEYPPSGIRVELMGPRYARWVFGPPDAENVVKGLAGEWCRVAVHRLDVAATALKAEGPGAESALRLVRAY